MAARLLLALAVLFVGAGCGIKGPPRPPEMPPPSAAPPPSDETQATDRPQTPGVETGGRGPFGVTPPDAGTPPEP
jgi:hypothetical protein